MNETLAQGIAAIIQYLGATPILLFFAVMGLTPWISMILIEYKRDKRDAKIFSRQDQRFEQVVKMYEDNVGLVKAQQDTNNNLIDLVTVSTGTQQTLVDYIKNNWWCPIAKDPGLLKTWNERKQG